MQKSKIIKSEKGSILVAVLIIFLMIAAISIAVAQRALEGARITIDTRKSHVAYQAADTLAEQFLDKLRQFDNNVDNIPENMDAYDFCQEGGWVCYHDIDEPITSSDSYKVKDILYIKQAGTESTSTRAIEAPILPRLSNLITGLKVESCNCGDARCGAVACNHSNVLISWSLADDSDVTGFEIRRGDDTVSDLSADKWERVCLITDMTGSISTTTSKCSNFNKSGSDYYVVLDNAEIVQSGKQYYFAIKAKNKKNFELDSPYSRNPVKFVAAAVGTSNNIGDGTKKYDCDRDEKHTGESLYNFYPPGHDGGSKDTNNGCSTVPPFPNKYTSGVGYANFEYNCPAESSGGNSSMECYMITDSNWRPNGRNGYSSGTSGENDRVASGELKNQCAIQMVTGTSDNIATGYTGTSETGYCKTAQASFESAWFSLTNPAVGTQAYISGVSSGYDDCQRQYSTKGYCLIPLDASSAHSTWVANTSWTLSNNTEVYNGVGSDSANSTQKPRCSRQECPTTYPDAAKCSSNDPNSTKGVGFLSFSASSTCNTQLCGAYQMNTTCAINCNTGYKSDSPGSDNASYLNGYLNVSYPGTCCKQDCNTVTYSCWNDCNYHTCAENTCANWTVVDDCWAIQHCPSDSTFDRGCSDGCGHTGSCSESCGDRTTRGAYTDTRACIAMAQCTSDD